jgi:uncharacterized membrane protein YfcA
MGAALGIVAGLMLGLTGAGGSLFAVPLLMFGLGWTVTQAVPVALIAVCAAAGVGTVAAWNASFVRYRAAMVIAAAGALTAPLGLALGARLPQAALAAVFAAILVLVAARLLAQALRAPAEARVVRATLAGDGAASAGPICRTGGNGRLLWTPRCAAAIGGIGAVTGFLSGLLGVGGGFVIVPALRSATVLSMHSAIATSLMAIALTSAGTVIATLAMGHDLPWQVAGPFVLGSLAGMLLGRRIAPHVVGPQLQQGFSVMMLLAAALLVLR